MPDLKYRLIRLGFDALHRTGVHRLAEPLTRGRGVILTLHHVKPRVEKAFSPCGLLEITPEFLDAVITRLRHLGYDLIALNDVPGRLAGQGGDRPFAVITFDDGYRDNAEFAAPVLRRHQAPYTVFITTGYADRTAMLWWLDLERIIAANSRAACVIAGAPYDLPAHTLAEKQAAYNTIYWALRKQTEAEAQRVMRGLCAASGIDPADTVERLCMNWDEAALLAADPLVSIGAHSLTHPMLARMDASGMQAEIARSRDLIEARIGRKVTSFAYPFGDTTAAGPREFEVARQAGFTTAVTTRPGLIYAAHAAHPIALPRLSLNGLFQRISDFDVLLSGLPFAVYNRGHRLNVA